MELISTNPARLYAVVSAALALLVYFVPSIPVELVLGLAAAILGIGEGVQRTEDRKTSRALSEPVEHVHDEQCGHLV